MALKEASPVYSPNDRIERSIQDNYHKFNGDWLTGYECKFAKHAIERLKKFNKEWIKSDIFVNRIKYFFAPEMSNNDEVVFLTHPIFVRDILENKEINSYIFRPVVFVSRSIAYYLFREYPIHITLDYSKIKSNNQEILLSEIGGMVICESNVNIKDALIKIESIKGKHEFEIDVHNINQLCFDTGNFQKVAISQIDKGVFKIDEDERFINPNDTVWDKNNRKEGKVVSIDPGEGFVEIVFPDKDVQKIEKGNFDRSFIVLSKTAQNIDEYVVDWNGQKIKVNSHEIEFLIKKKLIQSKPVKKIFHRYGIGLNELKTLKIDIKNLDGVFALTDVNKMELNKFMFDGGNFFRDYYFVLTHEILHWCSRVAEQKGKSLPYSTDKDESTYFADEEEIAGFIVAIASEIDLGLSEKQIWDKVYPNVKFHFHNPEDARTFFKNMFEKAQILER